MLLLRILGKLLLGLAFAALVFDGARMLATPDEGLMFASLRDYLAIYAGNRAKQEGSAQPAGETGIGLELPQAVSDYVVEPLMTLPISLVLGTAGAILFLLGYRRPPPEIVSD